MIKPDYRALQPMYALLAQQFMDDYHLMNGVACDIGTGHGSLGIELAKITHMKIIFLDIDETAISLAKKNFNTVEADNEAEFLVSPVEQIPLPNESVDFVMSRGSVVFWDDIKLGLQEIQRILKPGGVAIVGGGLGRYMPSTMRKRMREGIQRERKKLGYEQPAHKDFMRIVKAIDLKHTRIRGNGVGKSGKWLEIRKP